ncbi:hypothetical protein J2TS6_53960 [Paenibacillus albilobatus]|uniref:DUF308 domain-containing protein n=1 Tax=Paenibacillus albilobatus TaxID=2716884 RepID=A0A920CC74_9BACL|nr:DUF308 domain-containing protein [Paenibacillus albilobatus]GIO34255.1 hypothetical protein J2TS6_53960 [Paenibacillus albilobatus]
MNNRMEWTELGVTKADKWIIWTLFPVAGAAVGWFIPPLAEWALKLPWIPFEGPLKLISSLHGGWVTFATASLGALAGGWLSMAAMRETLQIRLSDQEVSLRIRDHERTLKRDEVTAVFLDNKQLVLLGADGQVLYREKPDTKRQKLAEAFIRHGYDWREQDPFNHEYTRWVPGCPDLSSSVNALFAAREKAIGKEEKEEAEELRLELSKLGVTVREEGKRQYWRMHGRRP